MPAAAFTIRTTTEDDWPRVRELRIENATDNPISYGATLETTLGMTEEDWRMRARRGQADDATSIVATETATGRWVGMMSAQSGDHDGPELILTGVYVSPDFRGRDRGVADALLARIVSWASDRGDVLRLWVDENGEPARKFYTRHGFELTGRSKPIGFAPGDTVEMARRLR